MPVRLIRAVSAFAAVTSLLLGPLTDGATRPSESPEACWLDVDTSATECFPSEAARTAAIVATAGPLVTGPADLASSELQTSALATYVLATFYADANYAGASLLITTQYPDLCGSHSYNGNSMPAGWNDRVSSYLGASVVAPLCLVKLYEHENRLGSSTSPAHSRATLGVMNDATSSYRISKAF